MSAVTVVLVDAAAFSLRAEPPRGRAYFACEILSGPDSTGCFKVRQRIDPERTYMVPDSLIVW